MRTRLATSSAACLWVALIVASVHAQAPTPADSSDTRIWEGVYTTAQATRGKAVYEAYCTRCHGIDMVGGRQGGAGGPALAGQNFWLDWERATLASLYSKVTRTMPADSPGSLRTDDYVDAMAYILSGNAFPAGTVEIPASGVGLDAIRIARKAGDVVEAPNFSLVQVVGCLTQSPGSGWALSRTTTPIATRDEIPTAAALKDAAGRALGTDTMRLFSTTPYKPESKSGQKVEVRGLLNRAPGETRLDVLSLEAIGACGT